MSEDPEKLRYPIGRFEPPVQIDQHQIERWISDIEALPADLRRTVKGFSITQLDTPYRPGGWTIWQVIHHLPDSHINTFIRFKWAPDRGAGVSGDLSQRCVSSAITTCRATWGWTSTDTSSSWARGDGVAGGSCGARPRSGRYRTKGPEIGHPHPSRLQFFN